MGILITKCLRILETGEQFNSTQFKYFISHQAQARIPFLVPSLRVGAPKGEKKKRGEKERKKKKRKVQKKKEGKREQKNGQMAPPPTEKKTN